MNQFDNLKNKSNFTPIVTSLLDTDYYKLLMLQYIWLNHRNVSATFAMKNRTKTVNLGNDIDIEELKLQLEYTQKLKFTKSELKFLNKTSYFRKDFIEYLKNDFALGEFYEVSKQGEEFSLKFMGSWLKTTLWEIYSMTIVNELRYKKKMRLLNDMQLDLMYSAGKIKLLKKLQKLKTLPNLKLSDFGTRRRHSKEWQAYCVNLAKEILGDKFVGTSNVRLAMDLNLKPIGTNAHELPMVLAAIAGDRDENIINAQYKVLEEWYELYPKNLHIFLPDTFGTTQFLKNAPEIVERFRGCRLDSKEPIEGGEELIQWWKDKQLDPTQHTLVFSDGLDVAIDGYDVNGDDICDIYNHFDGKADQFYGWGTNLTNDFRDCVPCDHVNMNPLSIVCKVIEAKQFTGDYKSAVKLSDNAAKRTGSEEEIKRYVRVFGEEGVKNTETKV